MDQLLKLDLDIQMLLKLITDRSKDRGGCEQSTLILPWIISGSAVSQMSIPIEPLDSTAKQGHLSHVTSNT